MLLNDQIYSHTKEKKGKKKTSALLRYSEDSLISAHTVTAFLAEETNDDHVSQHSGFCVI